MGRLEEKTDPEYYVKYLFGCPLFGQLFFSIFVFFITMLLMKNLVTWLICILAFFLPFHGAISVFLPDFFQFWKEGILMVVFCILVFVEGKRVVEEIRNLPLSKEEVFCILFLLWGVVLTLLSEDKETAFVAFRYLGLGFFVYLICLRLFRSFSAEWQKETFQKFSVVFVCSCVCSVLFGVWAKFFGGFDVLKDYYSMTVSSWVPGQMIPIYHEAGEFIRMQGGSSGPIVFSHLLLGGLFIKLKIRDKSSVGILDLVIWGILLFGIFQSFSRAAVLALVVGGIVWLYLMGCFDRLKSGVVGGLIVFLLVSGTFSLVNLEMRTNLFLRGGTSAHFSRPVEALKVGLEHPFLGDLGKFGPAARVKNLRENNDDRAMIAENVFIDYFVQMGIVGLVLALCFFVAVFRSLKKEFWPFLGGFLVVANLATIFDMTPIAITFFIILAFAQLQYKNKKNHLIDNCGRP